MTNRQTRRWGQPSGTSIGRRGPARTLVAAQLRMENLEARQLMAVGPQLLSINHTSTEILEEADILKTAPRELVFRFESGLALDLTSLSGIRLTRSGGDGIFGNANDVVITPGFIGLGDTTKQIVMRFAEPLREDHYRINIFGNDPDGGGLAGGPLLPLRDAGGKPFDANPATLAIEDYRLDFQLEVPAQIVAVVPQPLTRQANGTLSQQRDKIVVYFNDDDLQKSVAEDPRFYQLIFTGHKNQFTASFDTVTNTDDVVHTPVSVVYDAATDSAVLTFAQNLDQLSTGPGTYRLRVGADERYMVGGNPVLLPPAPELVGMPVDPGSSFSTATDLGVLGDRAKLISSRIDPQPYDLAFPGGNNDPGHRNIGPQSHLLQEADSIDGIRTFAYNFQSIYGKLPSDLGGTILQNLITEAQKQRAREIFEHFSELAGIRFVETANEGLTVVTGDIRALVRDVPLGRGGMVNVFGTGTHPITGDPIQLAIMDSAELWEDAYAGTDDPEKISWFQEAMQAIGGLLGLGLTNELPPPTVTQNNPNLATGRPAEEALPGDHDVVHLRHLYRPDSNDIDMIRFEVPAAGLFTAETIAERQTNASLLDTVLRLYRQDSVGNRQLVAQNDDYFSQDSLLRLELQPGTYFVGVSAHGNDQYDPTIENTGLGGTSQGDYQLRLNFRPQIADTLLDADGTAVDADGDGTPGGTFNFWFRTAAPAGTQAPNDPRTLYVDKAATGVGSGTLASPFTRLSDAVAAALPGDIVRVVGNGGQDGNLATLQDNLAYEIGFDGPTSLSDGNSLRLRKGVTLMIDAGAVLKLSNTALLVGSVDPVVDRSGAALQVLGTPTQNVHFTSYFDETIGRDTNPVSTTPNQGNWGGILFNNQMDQGLQRFDYERQGIFLNSIYQADIRYGGGTVNIDSVPQVVTAVDMRDARPTIAFSTFTRNADGALSATPDSFEETTFHSNPHQAVPFTSDYDRVGPDVYGNRLQRNSINGMLVRSITAPGTSPLPMTVSGRWDDRDIVHVVADNLMIKGDAGGPIGTLRSTPTGPNVEDRYDLKVRLDASLSVDPDVVVKLDGSRIEVGIGAQFLAEGKVEHEVIFTSLLDDRYGAGGTYDTNNSNTAADGTPIAPSITTAASPGDWGGLYFGPMSTASIDHAVLAYGGGVIPVGGSFAGFNVVEIHQARARIAHSTLENNAGGTGGQAPSRRFGHGQNDGAVIFVLGAQPVIVGNVIRNNVVVTGENGVPTADRAAAISINANALNHFLVPDFGRRTGPVDALDGFGNNQGPLIRDNRIGNNDINGLLVRGGTLTTQVVFDDTDITHVVLDEIIVPDFHTFGGLRLESNPTESLVVKLFGANAGFTANGQPLDVVDRIGGSVQVVGLPGFPVILTSVNDCTASAGFTPEGDPQSDAFNTGGCIVSSDPGSVTVPFVDIVVVMDESGTMFGAQDFSRQFILDLEAALVAAGIGSGSAGANRYGLTGFGGSQFDNPPRLLGHSFPVGAGGALFGTATEYTVAAQNLSINGGTEDGYSGVQFVLDNYTFRTDAERFIILVTDEDRDVVESQLNFNNVLASLTAADVTLQGILNASFLDGAGTPALAIDGSGNAFLDDGAGGFTRSTGGSVQRAAGTTQVDYIDMVFATGGVVGDINPINQDPLSAAAFGKAVISSIVEQVGGVVTVGQPGDWRSIRLDALSNDRNVDVTTEMESRGVAAPGVNATPDTAQFLGALATSEKSGDDNLRLGFEVHGYLSQPRDVDVYSFSARAGTEVWFDIDRTSQALDAVVELVDADGFVIARSDNSADELNAINSGSSTSTLFGTARVMARSFFLGDDLYTTNPHDAGMRVSLPGPTNSRNTYHVRVRSNNAQADSPGLNGVSQGAYQLQIRLRELDEVPGSTVQYADIRFATNGVELLGQPTHSPLVGGTAETTNPNETRTTAQLVVNPLQSERGASTIAGRIGSIDDVDWYRVEIDYEQLEIPVKHASVTFDIDFADGLSRPNTVLSVFDETGQLVAMSQDSNISDDRPRPTAGGDFGDASRGSVGDQDPFIGPIALRVGTYYVAVSSYGHIPQVLDQYLVANAANPLVRLEPVDSIVRIAEEHDFFEGPAFFGDSATFDPPVDPDFVTDANIVPFDLRDVVLYVSMAEGSDTRIRTVDPYTGRQETLLSKFGFTTADLAMRPDGRLFSFTLGANDAESGTYLEISSANGAATARGDDGILTYEKDPNFVPPDPPPDPPEPEPSIQSNNGLGVGIQFQALAFGGSSSIEGEPVGLFAIGNRGDFGADGNQYGFNIVYEFSALTGVPTSLPGADRTEETPLHFGPGTQILDKGPIIVANGLITGLAQLNDVFYAVSTAGDLIRIPDIKSPTVATTRTVTLPGTNIPIEFAGLTAGPQNASDGKFKDLLFAVDTGGLMYAFDTAGNLKPIFQDGNFAVQIKDAFGFPLSGVHGLAFSTLDRNLWHITDQREGDAGHGINVPVTRLRDTFVDSGGVSLHFGAKEDVGKDSFETGSLTPGTYDFPGGAHGSVITNPFSLAEYSYGDRPTLYFNYFLETEGKNSSRSDSLMLDSFRVFVSGDGLNNGEWKLVGTNNSFRDRLGFDEFDDQNSFDGYATNNNFDNFGLTQEIFDNTGGWRQARIALDQFAGSENVRIRFDFSTAGGLDLGFDEFLDIGTSELQAVAGNALLDGQSFTLQTPPILPPPGVTVETNFEFDLGVVLAVPAGKQLLDGETLTVNGKVVEFDSNGITNGTNVPVRFNDSLSARDVVATLRAALLSAGFTANQLLVADHRLNVPSASSISQTPAPGASAPRVVLQGTTGVSAGNQAVPVDFSMDSERVAQAIAEALAKAFGPAGVAPIDPSAPGFIPRIPQRGDVVLIVDRKVSDAGPLRLVSNSGVTGSTDAFFSHDPDDPNAKRALNNAFEGVYIDDIVVGFAERGELVTNAGVNDAYVTNVVASDDVIVTGPYQLEMRRAQDYAVFVPQNQLPDFSEPNASFDTNDRLTQGVTIVAPAGAEIIPGDTLSLGDGTRQRIYEFIEIATGGAPSNPDHVPVVYSTGDSAVTLAQRLADAINAQASAGQSAVSALILPTSARIELHGDTVVVDPAGIPNGFTGTISNGVGDRNPFLDQGQILVHSNIITSSKEFGIRVAPTARSASDLNAPHPSSVRNLSELNNQRLVPGITITNNLVVGGGEGGVLFSGEPSGVDPLGSVPFGRIVNNTIVGVPNAPATPVDIVLVVDTSSGMEAELTQLKGQLANINTQLVGANLLPQYALVQYPKSAAGTEANNDPVVVQTVVDFANFSAADSPFNQLAVVNNDTELGSRAVLEALDGIIDDTSVNFRNNSRRVVLLVTDEDDDSTAEDFAQAGTLLGSSNATFSYIGALGDGNSNARYGSLASRNGGFAFSVGTFLSNPAAFASQLAASLASTVAAGGAGVLVGPNASPTLLNNIFSNLGTGIFIDATSASTVIGGSVYKGNGVNSSGALGDFPIVLAEGEALFVNASANNFQLAPGSRAIDSSVNLLQDRPAMVSVNGPLGVPASPILAPDRDLTGQFRVDDPAVVPPPGVGTNVFKDRGALDRSDTVGPFVTLLAPLDNDTQGTDEDPRTTIVKLTDGSVSEFRIQISDRAQAGSSREGTGVNDANVTAASVSVTRNGLQLESGIDYRFNYDSTNNIIRLLPVTGVWPLDSTYVISFQSANSFLFFANNGGGVEDGDTFVVQSLNGQAKTFEFNSGYALQIPEAGASAIPDGGRIRITSGSRTVVFEFDRNGSAATGNTVIPYTLTSTIPQIADAIVTAITGAGLGLNPVHLGKGFVHIGGQANQTLDNLNSGLTVIGATGLETIGALPVTFIAHPTFDSSEMAAAMASAINSSGLPGVSATATGGARVVVQGASTVTGLTSHGRIRDVAGNALAANQANGQVQFTITLQDSNTGNVDFGDAPSPYPTLAGNNGAQHTIVSGVFLGASIDGEPDGQVSAAATADGSDEDGVTIPSALVVGSVVNFGVVASQAGRLDAWVDFNRDGDWSDAGEQIFTSRQLVAGANSLSATIPVIASFGESFARFRFSTAGGLLPTGAANDGEVEDYRVNIVANGWHNQLEPTDVNGLQGTSPVDAILIINELETHAISNPQTGQLPIPPTPPIVPPPYLDVNADGFVSPTDAILVINRLEELAAQTLVASSGSTNGSGSIGTPVAAAVPIGPIDGPDPASDPLLGVAPSDGRGNRLTTLRWDSAEVTSAPPRPRTSQEAPLLTHDIALRSLWFDGDLAAVEPNDESELDWWDSLDADAQVAHQDRALTELTTGL